MTRGFQVLVIVALAAVAGGCSSSSSSSTSSSDASVASDASDAANAGACGMPGNQAEAGPGACSYGRAFMQCTLASGGGCGCITDGGACPGCGGGTCTNNCASDQYAVSCGGPPLPDGGSYQSPPAGCVAKGNTPGGNTYYCCPCQ